MLATCRSRGVAIRNFVLVQSRACQSRAVLPCSKRAATLVHRPCGGIAASSRVTPRGRAISMALPESAQMTQPRWFTPGRLLLIFCLTNLMVYLDRGLIASNGVNGSPRDVADLLNPMGSGIQGEFDLGSFQDGMIPAAFMVGLFISSPVFAEACKHANAFRLLALGMGVWSAACLTCAASPNFAVLIVARMFVGVGEASFVALAAPFIDDYAPPERKTSWLSAFYLCIPVGFAGGYIAGGLVGGALGWRYGFIIEALVMLPFVIFAATAEPLKLQGSGGNKSKAVGPPKTIWQLVKEFGSDVRLVSSRPVWFTVVVGYTFYVAVLGVYSYFGPQAGKALFFQGDTSTTPDLVFGGVTVLTGVIGSVGGGLALDKLGSSLRNAALLCAGSSLVGMVLMLLAFNTTASFTSFMVLFALGELAIFTLQAPVAAIGLWCVPSELRPLAISLTTLSIHLFGDVPSPPLVGWLQQVLTEGKTGQEAAEEWRVSLTVITLLLLLSGAAFLLAARISTPSEDFRTSRGAAVRSEEVPEQGELSEGAEVPLLEEADGLAEIAGVGSANAERSGEV